MQAILHYEFGEPFFLEKEKQLLWGSQMWVPASYLGRALMAGLPRVPLEKRAAYLSRLDNRAKHLDVLSEMVPVLNIDAEVCTDFEVVGKGTGNTSLDWLLSPLGSREILLDVKSRSVDLIQQMDKPDEHGEMPAPVHSAALLFRSLEHKFMASDSKRQLQGVWIATHIKQEATELRSAFQSLDATKLHFAILAHWEPGGTILVRDEVDRSYLAETFGIGENDAFTFERKERA